MKIQESISPNEADIRLLEALASLNQISKTINEIGSADVISSVDSLKLIVESAIRVVPGSSAVIYTYNEAKAIFEPESRVSAEPDGNENLAAASMKDDLPRVHGIGNRAVSRRDRVLSYEESDVNVHPYYESLGVKAVGCFPMIVADQVVGVLYVYLYEERPFSRLELLMLENFVHQAAMAIYHSRRLADVRKDLTRKEDDLNRLNRAGMLISSRLKLEETLESILHLALDMTGAHYGIFRLLDKSGKNLVTHAFAGQDMTRPLTEELPLNSNSVMAFAARSRQTILIPDLMAEPWAKVYYPLDAGMQMRSELAVPLINASGRLEGVLNLESPEPGAFDENHSHNLQTMATFAVAAIQEVRLLDALQEVAQLILSQPCQKVLDHLTSLACDLLNASVSALWLRHENELVLESSCGAYVHGETMPVEGSLTGLAVLNRQAVVADDVRIDPRFHRRDLAKSQNWMRALIVPLLSNENELPLGAIGVYSSEPDPGLFAESDWDKKVLTFLSYYAVMAIQNESRQQALRSAQEQRSVAETFAAVGDIASNLLHHLNNKVGTIPVRVQSIQDKCAPALQADPYLANNLGEIERCAMEAMQTVRDNLSHLRPIRLEPVNIEGRIAEALQAAKLPPGIKIQLKGLSDLPLVTAGGQSLVFVFTNLIENAADAMQGKGIISINGKAFEKWVEITIRDTGPGIPPELHDRIFELTYSGRSGQRPGKLGFGLWWVKTLMTRLGGSVNIDSDGEHGTAFRLRLPRVEEVK
ncbi:GAF domain-containing protein [Leptolinea tardivitalis]|nr:GAF domain-containing protein [Leptolinea tardivitalis]GAP21088.1 signal transduction histidine kinase [Leptolinea tardivitalis]